MTVFSILGVTFGVAALVIVLSDGQFEEILKDKICEVRHMLRFSQKIYLGFPDDMKTRKKFPEALGMQAFNLTLYQTSAFQDSTVKKRSDFGH